MFYADHDLDWQAGRLVAGCWASGLAAGGWWLVAGSDYFCYSFGRHVLFTQTCCHQSLLAEL
jgi:hypothetical protein